MPKILIEHTIRRKNGTDVTMPPTADTPKRTVYRFRPRENDDRHTADVEDRAHLQRFLAISTFQIADELQTRGALPPAGTNNEGQGTEPGSNPAGDGDGSGKPSPNAAGAAGEGSGGGDGVPPPDALTAELEALDDDALAARYEKEVGKKPRANAARDTMISTIKAALAEKNKG